MTASGRQVTIAHGAQRATVTEVGATVREYNIAGRDILDGFPAGAMSTAGRGQVLMPWPNRIAGGSYEFDGETLQLALTEPHAGNAIHGLVRYANWTVETSGASWVTMAHRLHPQPGYPFLLDLRVGYRLGDDGLTVRIEAINAGTTRCPFGAGAHPYVLAPAGRVDAMTLRAPAAAWYEPDDRRIPTACRPVEGTPYDFREPRAVGATEIDTAFTDLERGPNGRATVDAGDVQVWMDAHFTHLMLFTGDTLAGDARRRGLAVEPMTCAPNAFRSGDGLRVLERGDRFDAEWGIRLRGT